ncbi:MAG: hypothetical protein KAT28_03875 [Candidatus Aenigmarchaeota archaeon]|nr:hypothetical protein [Candidatus Aenigmarchaeota archaeon]
MKYSAVYELKTSEIKDYVIFPVNLKESKEFEASTDEEALKIAQYIGYHMAKIINPEEFDIKKVFHKLDNFSQVTIKDLYNKETNHKLDLPVQESHYADSLIIKSIRSHGKDCPVEIVGVNSYLLGPHSFIAKKKLPVDSADRDLKELYSNIYKPLMKDEDLLKNYGELIYPENKLIITPDTYIFFLHVDVRLHTDNPIR